MAKKNHNDADESHVEVQKKLVALKDFRITQNEYDRPIKKDEDISDVPQLYHANLKAEGVIP